MPPASFLPVPGACNWAHPIPGIWKSASLSIKYAGMYMGAYSQVRLGVSSLLGVYLRMYSEVYLGAYFECAWEWISSRLRVCHRVQLGVYLGVWLGLCLRTSCELTWERTVKQAGSVQSSAIGSIRESMPGCVLQNVHWEVFGNILWGVLGSVLGVYLGESWHWKSSRLGVYNRMQLEMYFRPYLGACRAVHFTDWFQVWWMQYDV
jgi:uncharacterized membrane protein YeaQ/YmgE (transglycosylase-associated protein family)